MKQTIAELRQLVDKLDSQIPSENEEALERSFSGMELPEIMQDIVDFLMPQLKPYEIGFYLYMFRHSVMATGKQYVRISTSQMRSGVFKPTTYARARKDSTDGAISPDTVRESLRELETIGAIRKEGDSTQSGTLYKIFLPEEIESCRALMKEQAAAQVAEIDEKIEVDYYNIRQNRTLIYERDNYICQHCQKQLTRFSVTLDHVQPVSKGGDNSYNNLLTSCRECNSKKNSKILGDFLADANPSY